MDRLPPELRLDIYERVVCLDGDARQMGRAPGEKALFPGQLARLVRPSLFTVSHKTYAEAREAFFRANTIKMHAGCLTRSHEQFVRHANFIHLGKVHLHLSPVSKYFLPRLQDFVIDLHHHEWLPEDSSIGDYLRSQDHIARVTSHKIGLRSLDLRLRLRIFEFALRADWPLYPKYRKNYPPEYIIWSPSKSASRKRSFCTSLFTVDRRTYHEAQEVFYEMNTISIRQFEPKLGPNNTRPHVPFIRHVELDLDAFREYMKKPGLLDVLRSLQSIVVGYDYDFKFKDYLRRYHVKASIETHEIGVHELVPQVPRKEKIWVKHRELLAACTEARKLTPSHSILQLSLIEGGQELSGATKESQTKSLFALWISCFDALKAIRRRLPAVLDFTEEELRMVIKLEHQWKTEWKYRRTKGWEGPFFHEQLPDDASLLRVSLEDGCSEELVAWAGVLAEKLFFSARSEVYVQRVNRRSRCFA